MIDANKRFTAAHHAVSRIGEILVAMDLDAYLEDLARADVAGPNVDPLMHAIAKDNIARMIELARCLKLAQDARQAIRDHVDEKVNHSNSIAAIAWAQNLSV